MPISSEKNLADLNVVGLQFPKHVDSLPSWVLNLSLLKLLDLIHAALLYFANDGQEGQVAAKIRSSGLMCFPYHSTRLRSPLSSGGTVRFSTLLAPIGKVLMFMQQFEGRKTSTCACVAPTWVWCVFQLFAWESTISRSEITMAEAMIRASMADAAAHKIHDEHRSRHRGAAQMHVQAQVGCR
jgi:hypothetical protein